MPKILIEYDNTTYPRYINISDGYNNNSYNNMSGNGN